MKPIILILFLANTSFASFLPIDMYKIAHLEDVNSVPACAGAVITQIRQVRGCQSLPEVCKGQGQICLVQTTLGKFAAVCNATPNTSYNYCE